MNRIDYQINELFHTVQGEGMFTGTAATFIRLQGCTVGCPWCDSGPLADLLPQARTTNGMTRNTWSRGGERMSVENIVWAAYEFWHASDHPHFVITGGEPTLYDLDSLINGLRSFQALRDGNRVFIQLETSGQNNLKGNEKPDWITWSPKKNLDYVAPLTLLELVNEIKFVVDSELTELTVVDIEALFEQEFHRTLPIILMPEGCPPGPEMMKKAFAWAIGHPGWRVMDRLQYRLGVR